MPISVSDAGLGLSPFDPILTLFLSSFDAPVSDSLTWLECTLAVHMLWMQIWHPLLHMNMSGMNAYDSGRAACSSPILLGELK